MMSPQDADELSLVNLPPDIVRKFIRIGQESIDGMRMVSHQWNRLTVDHFHERKHLPKIESMHWKINILGRRTFRVCLQDKYRSYFGVENLFCEPKITDNGSDDLVEISSTTMYDKGKIENSNRRLFHRCSFIQRIILEMDIDNRREDMFSIARAVREVPIDTIELKIDATFTKQKQDVMMEFVRGIKKSELQSLVLSTKQTNVFRRLTNVLSRASQAWTDRETEDYDNLNFFAEMTQLVPSIDLTFQTTNEVAATMYREFAARVPNEIAGRAAIKASQKITYLTGDSVLYHIIIASKKANKNYCLTSSARKRKLDS